MLEAPEIEEGPALEGIRKAFEIELGGQAFYRRAAARQPSAYRVSLMNRIAASGA